MRIAALLLLALLAGCGSKPQAPPWQSSAHGGLERFEQAWLTGDNRVAQVEFTRARSELAATGKVELVARAELTRCALQVASLVFEGCPGFESLRADAPAAERAYAAYLLGEAADAQLLPPHHRAVIASGDGAAFRRIEDPLSRLVALGVAVRAGRGSPELLQLGTDTASGQGWRRPLLAWLGAQVRLAEGRGAAQEAAALRRRIALVAGER
ncbi:MAG TPA: hypothetical protein VEA40_04370 [Ramlibacter sp.]|nr:hypothetical protein [Ramlibacter sp.]